MITTMKDNRELIENVRNTIQNIQKQQDTVYNTMIKVINPTKDQEEWLWEYCFNCDGSNEVYTEYVRENLKF